MCAYRTSSDLLFSLFLTLQQIQQGTVNTYAIDGMGEMSPEEYQKALQQSVIDRQKERKRSGLTTGNKASWDYLSGLSGGKDKGVLNKSGMQNKKNWGGN